jgi:hypothetical protein
MSYSILKQADVSRLMAQPGSTNQDEADYLIDLLQ